jgi:hypothetical protein
MTYINSVRQILFVTNLTSYCDAQRLKDQITTYQREKIKNAKSTVATCKISMCKGDKPLSQNFFF